MSLEVTYFCGGYCRQLLALIDRRSFRWVKFHAAFLAFRHPKHGTVLIDTGYGERFLAATSRWPYRLYRWATPVKMRGATKEILRGGGIDPVDIKHLVLTHFHADHLGGLHEFPDTTIHYHEEAWHPLAALTPFRQVRAAYLPDLVPAWLAERSAPIAAKDFGLFPDLPFPLHDLFGDGLIKLVYLPGHAPGHVGVLLETSKGRCLYAADAYWRLSQLETSTELLAPALRLQWDVPLYQKTIRQLRTIDRKKDYTLLACHAPETEALFVPDNSAV